MNGLPYYPRYPRDFFEGTAGMPFELKAAYGLVLDLIYMMGDRGLPDDPHFISGQLGMSVRKWNLLRADLISANKVVSENGIISNKRADKERIIQRKFQDNQSEKATGSRKNNELQEPGRSHTDTDTKVKEDTDVSSKKCVGFEELSAVLDASRAKAVIDHRRKIRKPLTAHAAKLLAGKFAQTAHPNVAADHMIANGWQGFEPEWASKLQPAKHMRSGQYRILRTGEVQHRNDPDDDWFRVEVEPDAIASIALHDYRRPLEAVG